MNIHLATDHAGLELKNKIVAYLQQQGHNPIDHGPHEYDGSDDYPDTIPPAVHACLPNFELCIVLGGSGQGEAMVANKIPGARAIVYYGGSEEILRLSREHNNANVLSLGARFLTDHEVFSAINVWLGTKFLAETRHERRLIKLRDIENSNLGKG